MKGEHGFGVVPDRKRCLVNLGKQAWEESGPAKDADTFKSGLGAASRLCAAADEAAGLQWAEELWSWAGRQRFQLDALKYHAFTVVLEVYKFKGRVDQMLSESKGMWEPSRTILGELVNTAAEHRD